MKSGERGERAEVEERGAAEHGAAQALAGARAVVESLFELRLAVVDEVVADVRVRLRLGVRGVGLRGQLDRRARHLGLARVRALGDALDDVAVAVARLEVHQPVDARGVFAEDGIDEADRLEEVAPVERREQAHRGDDVADRDLRGGLPLVFELDGLLKARALLLLKPAFEPVEDGRERGVLLAQALRELHDERAPDLLFPAEAVGEVRDEALGLALDHLQQFVGERVGLLALQRGCGRCAWRAAAGSRPARA